MPSGRRSVLITTGGNFIPPAVGLATAPMLASALGPAGRGELAAATTALILGVSITTFGLPDALVYYSARKGPNHRNMVLKITALLGLAGLLCSACIFALSGFLSSGDAHLAKVISYSGLAAFPALILASVRGVASGLQAWALVTYEKVFSHGIRLLGLTAAYVLGALTLELAAFIMAVTQFIGILAYMRLPRIARAHGTDTVTDPQWTQLLSFGSRVWVGSLTGALLLRVDQLLLLPLVGARQLGIYAVAVSIAEMALLFNYAVNMVMNAREAHAPSSEVLAMATRITGLVTSVGCVAIAMLSVWAVPLFFGDEFSPVVPVVWVLLLGTALGNPGSVVGAGLTGRGRPGLRSLSLTVALLINVACLLGLAPLLGAVGAAGATAAANVVFGTLNLLWFKRYYGVPIRTFLGIRRGDLVFLLEALRALRAGGKHLDDPDAVKAGK